MITKCSNLIQNQSIAPLVVDSSPSSYLSKEEQDDENAVFLIRDVLSVYYTLCWWAEGSLRPVLIPISDRQMSKGLVLQTVSTIGRLRLGKMALAPNFL